MSECPVRIGLTFKIWSQTIDRDISFLEKYRDLLKHLAEKLWRENERAFVTYYENIMIYGATTLTLQGDPRDFGDDQ